MPTIQEVLQTAFRHHQAGQLPQAEQLYFQILQVQPDQVDALHLLGVICQQTGRPQLAVDYLRQALIVKPDFFEVHCNLANALRDQGRPGEALAAYDQALRLRPGAPEVHFNQGNVLRECGRLEEAAASYQQAITLRPDYAKAGINLGNTLLDLGKPNEAVGALRRAVQLQPNSARAQSNLGNALRELGQLSEAVTVLRHAIQLDPQLAEAHNNLGAALQELGQIDDALACLDQAIRLRPDYANARMNRGILWLYQADYERGWVEYEWRWKAKGFVARSFSQPGWDGSPIVGKTILLYAEQGLGDTIQFVRYAALVKELGARVIVECHPPLLRLLTGCPGVDELIPLGMPLPPFDVHAPLMSLPRLFRTTLLTVPGKIPYLFADPALVERWKQELATIPGFKIGIVWQGNPKYKTDRWRSFALRQFAPVARVSGVRLISLQKGLGKEQLSSLGGEFEVIDLANRLDEPTGPFLDTAAVMKSLDLVISADTATAHLAGALGVPIWLAQTFVADWRWMQEREDSPWYPTLRLFRQKKLGEWGEVFERVREAVVQLLQAR